MGGDARRILPARMRKRSLTGLRRPLPLRLLLQIHGQPRQPAVSGPHDHPGPGERGQGVASGEEPRPRGPEGGGPGQQDGV